MVKPAPTRTKSKVPVNLSPVKALTPAPAAPPPSADKLQQPAPAVAPAAPPRGAHAAPAASPAPVPVAKWTPAAKPQVWNPPQKAAPTKVWIEKPVANVIVPKVAEKAVQPAAAVSQPVVPEPKPVPAKPQVLSPPKKAAPTELRIEKPVANVVAPKVAAKAAKPAAAVSRPVAPEPKPVPAKPAAPESAPAKLAPVQAAPVAKPTEPAPAAAKAAPEPASLDSLPLPRPPEAAAVVTATALSQALTMARAFGALQARMLDHACAELEATLGDAQTLARSNSASEAIALQAKAVRRSYESYAEHLKELARTANAALRKD